MRHRSIRRLGLLLVAILALTRTAAAQRLIVADVSPPSDESGALTLLLRSYLSEGRRAVVPIGELMRTIKRVDRQRDRAEVRPGEEGKLLGDLGADRLLVVEFDKSGPSLAASYKILLPTGTVLSAGRQLTPRGDYHRLAHAVATSAAPMLGTQASAVVNVSLDELRPFARALTRYQRGDYTGAIAEMYRANQHLGDTLAAVRDLASEVAHAPSLSEADRIQAARLAGDLKLAQQLGDKAKTSGGRAENARTLAGHGTEEEASSAVDKLKSSKDPSAALARAELALRKGDKLAAEKDLAPLLAKRPPDPRALALVADLPPGALSPETEKLAIEASKDAKGGDAGMQARIGVRAATGGSAEGVPVASMDSVPGYQVQQMATKLGAEAPVALKAAAKERGDKDGSTALVNDMIGEGGEEGTPAEVAAAAGVPLNMVKGGGKGGGKDGEKKAPPSLLADEKKPDAIAVADAFSPLLDPIAALHRHPGEHALMIALPDVDPWAFMLPRRGLMRSALRRVLGMAPYELFLAEARPLSGPMTKAALMAAAAEIQPPASLVIAYQISLAETEEGKRTAIKLVVLDTTTGAVQDSAFNLEAGLASFYPNPLWLGIIGVLMALVLGWGYMMMFRTGSVLVELTKDASAEEAFTHVLLSRKPKAPTIDDLYAFMEKERSQPAKKERHLHTAASGKQEFDHITPGRWYVHTYGVVVRGGEPIALGAGLTKSITVSARDTVKVVVDLEKKRADLRLKVEDGGPKAGVRVYLATRVDDAVLTDADGRAVLEMPLGDHKLILELGEERFSLSLGVISTKTQNLTVDLPRERQRRKLEAGLAIVGHGDEAGSAAADDVPEQYRASSYQSQPEIPAATPAANSTRIGSAAMAPQAESHPALGMLDDLHPPSIGMPEIEMPAQRPTVDMRAGGSELLGRYQRTGELGRGAMGVVYRGRDTSLERDVAIKVVSDEVRRNPDALQMFVAEAKAMAALNHPNLVTVFDQGQTAGELFMVMELVDGKTLETVLAERGPLAVTEVIDIGEQLAAGLQYAHGRRILHRDIKPANIFYSSDGVVKLGDFGLARAVQKVRLSQTKVSGTPLYMSPEQIRGTDIDFRSDLYSVGCTLYELLTGAPPFVTGEVMYHHMYTEPAVPSTKVAGIPAEVDALLMRCLAKEPAARPQTAEELRQVLRPLRARFS